MGQSGIIMGNIYHVCNVYVCMYVCMYVYAYMRMYIYNIVCERIRGYDAKVYEHLGL